MMMPVSCLVVRPLAGAGIEIDIAAVTRDNDGFAPSRGRELKSGLRRKRQKWPCSPPRGGGN